VTDELRRARIRAVVRDFFRDKPPGTTIEQHELDEYHRRLREAAQKCRHAEEHPMSTNLKFIHDALQPAEELGAFATVEEYADAMLELARLRKIATRLYHEERLNGDEMRDLGHVITALARSSAACRHAGGHLMNPIPKFVHDALQPAEELGAFATVEEYADAMLALAREATRRACVASERGRAGRAWRLLVATFDVSHLTGDEVDVLSSYVTAQAEGKEGIDGYPDVDVTTEIFPPRRAP
jgi:hypothetical protein